MIDVADVGRLAGRLLGPTPAPAVVLFGAGASNVRPSRLPFADPWKALLMRLVADRAGAPAGWADDLADVARTVRADSLPGSPLKLEAIFQACEERTTGLGTRLATAVQDAPGPNALHVIVAEAIARGTVRAVITTNWDRLLEDAISARLGAVRTWVISEPWDPGATVYKLHGSLDVPLSLRHTFHSINRRFDRSTLAGMRALTTAELIVLGYAGTDYDVLDAIGGGGTVSWLHAAPVADLRAGGPPALADGARVLADRRPVVAVGGGFQELATTCGQPWLGMDPTGDVVAGRSRSEMAACGRSAAAAILGDCLFRVLVAQPSLRVGHETVERFDARFMEWLTAQRASVGEDVYGNSVAARAQHAGAGLRSALIYLRLAIAMPSARPALLSTAADCGERVAMGLIPGQRILTLPIHGYAVRHDRDPWLKFRYARSVASSGRHRWAIRLLTDIIELDDVDAWVQAHAHRRRAWSKAVLRRPGWEADIREAEMLFSFEQRTLEIASTLRTDACCRYIAGDRVGAWQSLRRSDAASGHGGNRTRNAALRKVMRLPPTIGRLLVSLLAS